MTFPVIGADHTRVMNTADNVRLMFSAKCRFLCAEPMVCPLCRKKVPAMKLHECQQVKGAPLIQASLPRRRRPAGRTRRSTARRTSSS
jgi:hypothetical protein